MPRPEGPFNPQPLKTWGRSRAVRWDKYDYASDANVHLTICANHGEPFHDRALAQVVCHSVEFYCRKLGYHLFGYCLMPDHLHVLLSPADSGTAIGQWLRAFKSYTSRMHANAGGEAPLWQRSAHDHVCREDETAETVLRYMAENPVRRGLVEDWRKWPWTRVFVEL
jgi:REP element-mobilizing transposase RayT